jgi:branched-chain amino acid transport system substrate-binding protein
VIAPAGLDRSTGIVADAFIKDPTDPQWADDPGFREWLAWMEKYNPRASVADQVNVLGYSTAQTLEQVLRRCGDDLSRENVMRQAANLRHLRLPMLLPGMEIHTSSDNYHPIRQMRLMRFDGKNWVLFGDLITQ